jgi:hypothetical protein
MALIGGRQPRALPGPTSGGTGPGRRFKGAPPGTRPPSIPQPFLQPFPQPFLRPFPQSFLQSFLQPSGVQVGEDGQDAAVVVV